MGDRPRVAAEKTKSTQHRAAQGEHGATGMVNGTSTTGCKLAPRSTAGVSLRLVVARTRSKNHASLQSVLQHPHPPVHPKMSPGELLRSTAPEAEPAERGDADATGNPMSFHSRIWCQNMKQWGPLRSGQNTNIGFFSSPSNTVFTDASDRKGTDFIHPEESTAKGR